VETVGVGQSEIIVRSMVDFFLLILIAGAGDELQGIKKGVVEIADAILINKADGPGKQAALTARSEFERVLHYLRPATEGWQTHAFNASALKEEGIEEIWRVVTRFDEITRASRVHDRRRQDQERTWLNDLVREGLTDIFESHPGMNELRDELEQKVASGEMPATAAARLLLERFQDNR
ncbi:MAG: methylmalonyl Co-A mutase-associated GTPase MeaB, partial [bacterium]|nr:methylmalonyl Co-A mutase-associated GTPase MeaB [bacterium]